MNDSLKPDTTRESHIVEIEEKKEKKAKKQRPAFPVRAFIIILAVTVVTSALSGAGGAFLMLGFLRNMTPTEQTTAANEFIIPDQTEADRTTEAPSEAVSVNNTEVTGTEAPTQAETLPDAEPTTAVSALTKGEIYSSAVNSIVAVTSEYQRQTSTWLGTYTESITETGTGFAVTNNGYIATNHHVVKNAEKITVKTYAGKQYTATLVGAVPENDFAVIKINANTVPVNLGYSSALKVGDDIMVIGNALGELSYTFTDGIVSHLSRDVDVGNNTVINMFQTNAAINNGNSGGPVYNMDGEVVGIASAKLASEHIEGLGFCIPIDNVRDMMTDLIIFGYVTGRPLLGVTLQTVTSSMASRYSLPTGCYIVALDTDSPCYKAGIRSGDVITKLGGKVVSDCNAVKDILSKKSAGDTISIVCYRDGATETYSVVLDEKKSDTPRTEYSNVFDF